MQSSKVGRSSGYVSAFAPITRTKQALASLNKAHLMPILSYILVLNHSISPVILQIARCSPRNCRGGTRTCRSRWLRLWLLLLLLNLGQQASGKSHESFRIDSACHHRQDQCGASTQHTDWWRSRSVLIPKNGELKFESGHGLLPCDRSPHITNLARARDSQVLGVRFSKLCWQPSSRFSKSCWQLTLKHKL